MDCDYAQLQTIYGAPIEDHRRYSPATCIGCDMKIGLDIAWIALKKVADILVLVTGDSDFVPVMKFARKEGMRSI
jgi:uncharacterized LabA/DUF88 family protein